MQVVQNPAELASSAGGAFVPTMGALHEGHLALMRHARPLAAPLVASIFINPTQFGSSEDLQRYPGTMEADIEAARTVGVNIVFAPDVSTMYPPDLEIRVPSLPAPATRPGLEDAHRPGHFAGVCQVVARLFDLVRPSLAVFGEKDYQQLLVVTEMVRHEGDRWAGLRIVPHPTVREPDGLALSSRNANLPEGGRDRALGLYRALTAARREAASGADAQESQRVMTAVLSRHDLDVDYAVVRDAATLEPLASPGRPARALIAARLGDVRLIDNIQIGIGHEA